MPKTSRKEGSLLKVEWLPSKTRIPGLGRRFCMKQYIIVILSYLVFKLLRANWWIQKQSVDHLRRATSAIPCESYNILPNIETKGQDPCNVNHCLRKIGGIVGSSRSLMFFETSALKNFATFTGKQLELESLFNKVAGLNPCNFIKKRLQYRCLPV